MFGMPDVPGNMYSAQLQNSPDVEPVVRQSVRVADVVLRNRDEWPRVVLAKVDVEGHEHGVLESLTPLVRAGALENLIIEVTPMWYQSHNISLHSVKARLAIFLSHGYR